jgi:hypothetical protein
MENLSKIPKEKTIGQKIRTLTVAIGLSALSLFSDSDALTLKNDAIFFSDKKPKTEEFFELEKNKLESSKKNLKEMAFFLIKADLKISEAKNIIKKINVCIEMAKYQNFTDEKEREEILKEIEYLKERKKTFEKILNDRLSYVNNIKEKNTNSIELEAKVKEIRKSIFLLEVGRKWVLDNINNPKYFSRLYNEKFKDYLLRSKNGKHQSMSISKKDLEDYIKKVTENSLNSRKMQASDDRYVISSDIEKSYSKDSDGSQNSDLDIFAFYSEKEDKPYFGINDDSLEIIHNAVHEFTHKVTEGSKKLPVSTIELLGKSFSVKNIVMHIKSGVDTLEVISYCSDPVEMYARKKQFEYDLERLGIKKYEDEFTMEHYKKVILLGEKGLLSEESELFLYMIKPEMMKKVMNEISKSDFDNKKYKDIA